MTKHRTYLAGTPDAPFESLGILDHLKTLSMTFIQLNFTKDSYTGWEYGLPKYLDTVDRELIVLHLDEAGIDSRMEHLAFGIATTWDFHPFCLQGPKRVTRVRFGIRPAVPVYVNTGKPIYVRIKRVQIQLDQNPVSSP
jgi:hypothetical protein